jgi:hypothetical protein
MWQRWSNSIPVVVSYIRCLNVARLIFGKFVMLYNFSYDLG